MKKKLNGSAGTGKKIMENRDIFNYSYKETYATSETTNYKFDWSFEDQFGTAVIKLNPDGKINQFSFLNCEKCNDFPRPLGAYNDSSLYEVFQMMLDNQNIPTK